MSGFLAEQYDADRLKNANLQATDFIMVAALASETSADVVSKEEERMPFGGFEVPIESEQYEHGRLYILCGVVEVKPKAPALAKMDPWYGNKQPCRFRLKHLNYFVQASVAACVRESIPQRCREDVQVAIMPIAACYLLVMCLSSSVS